MSRFAHTPAQPHALDGHEPPAMGAIDRRVIGAPLTSRVMQSWPWLASAAGLCAAVLLAQPAQVDHSRGAPQPPESAASRVKSWRGTAVPPLEHPSPLRYETIPNFGYHGVVRPDPEPQLPPEPALPRDAAPHLELLPPVTGSPLLGSSPPPAVVQSAGAPLALPADGPTSTAVPTSAAAPVSVTASAPIELPVDGSSIAAIKPAPVSLPIAPTPSWGTNPLWGSQPIVHATAPASQAQPGDLEAGKRGDGRPSENGQQQTSVPAGRDIASQPRRSEKPAPALVRAASGQRRTSNPLTSPPVAYSDWREEAFEKMKR